MWKNESHFLILHIKIRLQGNFHENLRKKFLTDFFNHFWLIEAKMKIKMKEFGKINSVFAFSISKLGYAGIFFEIQEKKFLTHFLRHFWFFHKNLREKRFFLIFTWEGPARTEVSKGLIELLTFKVLKTSSLWYINYLALKSLKHYRF